MNYLARLAVTTIILMTSVFQLRAQATKDYWICLSKDFELKTSKINNRLKFESSNANLNTTLNGLEASQFRSAFPRANELSSTVYRSALKRTHLLSIPAEKRNLVASLAGFRNEIELIEEVPVETLLYTPNDYALLYNPEVNTDWTLDLIQAKNAWNITKGSPSIRIAIIDTDFDVAHPDLQGQIHYDAGGSCTIPIFDMFDCYDCSHGTRVAGVAGARTNNGIGKSSIGFNSKLMVYRNYGTSRILDAALDGAHVINASFGSTFYSQTNQNVINAAVAEGAIIVAAAGNGESQNIDDYWYPASYENVISVGAVNQNKDYGCTDCDQFPPGSGAGEQLFTCNDKIDVNRRSHIITF